MRMAKLHMLFCGSQGKYRVSYIWNRTELVVKQAGEDRRPSWMEMEDTSSAGERYAAGKKIVGEGAKIKRRKGLRKRCT